MKAIEENLQKTEAIVTKLQAAADILKRIMKASKPIKKPHGDKKLTIDEVLQGIINKINSFKAPVFVNDIKIHMEGMFTTYSKWLKHHEEISQKLYVSKRSRDAKIKTDAEIFETVIKEVRSAIKALELEEQQNVAEAEAPVPAPTAVPLPAPVAPEGFKPVAPQGFKSVAPQGFQSVAPAVDANPIGIPAHSTPIAISAVEHEQLAKTLAFLYQDESDQDEADTEQTVAVSPPPQPLPISPQPQLAQVREIKVIPRQAQVAVFEEEVIPTVKAEVGEEDVFTTDGSMYEIGEEFSDDTDTESPKAVEEAKKAAKPVTQIKAYGEAPAMTELQRAWQKRRAREDDYVAANPVKTSINN